MAQIGSRLIDATAGKITEDFFKAFEAHLQAAAPAGAVAAPPAVAVAETNGGIAKLWWLIGAVVALAIIYFMIRK